MPYYNGYYYPVLSNGTVVGQASSGGSSGGSAGTYSGSGSFPSGSAASPGIAIGTGAGLFQAAANTLDIALSGASMIHIDPGVVPYTGLVQISGPFYTDGTSPLLQFGSGAWGSGLLSFPDCLRVRSCDGYYDKKLIAGALYASGYISGSEDSIQTLAGSVQAGTGRCFRWWNRSRIIDGGDGIIQLTNNASSSFTRLMFGASSSFSCSLVVAGTTLKVRNGIDTGDANLTAGAITANGALSAGAITGTSLTTSGLISGSALAIPNASFAQLTASYFTGSVCNFSYVNALTGNFGTINFTQSGSAGIFTDITASSVTTQKIVSPVFNNTSLGSTDFNSSLSGTYVFCDYAGDKGVCASQLGNAYVINSITTPSSVNTYPAGVTQAAVANHPGIEIVQVQNVGDIAAVSTSCITNALQVGFVINALTNYTMQHIFYTPSVASVAGERYTLSVGTLAVTTTQIFGGIYLEYSDNINSGNWVLCENGNNNGGGRQVIANSSTPFVTASWNKLLIQQNGTNVTASLNGTFLCAGPSVIMKQTAPVNNIAAAIGGMRMTKSTTTTSASISALLDYSSLLSNMSR